MIARLTIVKYPKWMGWAGFLSMALFRIPLWFSSAHSFWKLMGCGKNGSFDKTPDLRQWALLEIWDASTKQTAHPRFIQHWWKLFGCRKRILMLNPIEGHGSWDHKQVFGTLPKKSMYDGKIAILTRATIRLNKLKSFWSQVDAVAQKMSTAPGFQGSVGIGEIPWIKQATFSIWESKAAMTGFAYKMHEHAEVVRKTRSENWYSEEMFVRFQIIDNEGDLNVLSPIT